LIKSRQKDIPTCRPAPPAARKTSDTRLFVNHAPISEGKGLAIVPLQPDHPDWNRNVGPEPDKENALTRQFDVVEGYYKRQREIKEIVNTVLSQVPPDQLSTTLMKELFNRWAFQEGDPYDEHMARTGHDRAVESLILQLRELQGMHFGKDCQGLPPVAQPRIFGDNVLEMSCGTGTVLKLLCQNIYDGSLPQERGRLSDDITFIANDLSRNMKAIARDKLAPYVGGIEDRPLRLKEAWGEVRGALEDMVGMFRGKTSFQQKGAGLPRLIFTGEDLRELHMHHHFDTAILSQTLHLITDPKKLPAEQADAVEPDEHRAVKLNVVRSIFEKLPYGGHFVLIDEWQPLLTQTANCAEDNLVNALFYRTLRPLRERSSIIDIMKHVKDACFVAELKERIDKRHSMYAIVYRKDRRDDIRTKGHLPQENSKEDGEINRMAEHARNRAVSKVYEAFRAVDAHFVEAYRQASGESNAWVNFIPLGTNDEAGTIWCCPEDIKVTHQKLQDDGSADMVVLSQVLQRLDDDGRRNLIARALGTLKLGGALMFIEEWPPASQDPHTFRNRDFRSMMTDLFEGAMFEGALRETIVPGYDSGMYGYLYRKKEA
jgi:SAM-dependent methyltransferase